MRINLTELDDKMISDVKFTRYKETHQREIHLSWKYAQRRNSFMIHACNARVNLDVKDVIKEWNESNVAISWGGHEPAYVLKEKDRGIVFCCKEEDFRKFNGKMILPEVLFDQGIPYVLHVYLCNYDEGNRELSVYRGTGQNYCYLPVEITAFIREKKQWFSQYKDCFVSVPSIPEYKSGAFLYQISGMRYPYPIPEKCLNREFYIQLPKESQVTIKVSDEFQKLYNVRITKKS